MIIGANCMYVNQLSIVNQTLTLAVNNKSDSTNAYYFAVTHNKFINTHDHGSEICNVSAQ